MHVSYVEDMEVEGVIVTGLQRDIVLLHRVRVPIHVPLEDHFQVPHVLQRVVIPLLKVVPVRIRVLEGALFQDRPVIPKVVIQLAQHVPIVVRVEIRCQGPHVTSCLKRQLNHVRYAGRGRRYPSQTPGRRGC